MDFKSQDEVLEAFLRIYENFLMHQKSLLQKQAGEESADKISTAIEYKLEEICHFIDQLFDLGTFIFNSKPSGYTAHGKAWFKAKIHAYLRRQVQEKEAS